MDEAQITENKTKIESLENQMNDLKIDIHNIYNIIGEIRDKLLGRPTWVVLLLMSGMSSLIIGLLTALTIVLIEGV